MLSIAQHNLRYMDNILGSKLTKINGRRYYKNEDIDLIKKELDSDKIVQPSYHQLLLLNDDKMQNFSSNIIKGKDKNASLDEVIKALRNMRLKLIRLV